jgi:hypothetical protein
VGDVVNTAEVRGLDHLPSTVDEVVAGLKATSAIMLGTDGFPPTTWKWLVAACPVMKGRSASTMKKWVSSVRLWHRNGQAGPLINLARGYIIPLAAELTDTDTIRPHELADRLAGLELDATMLRLLISALSEGDGSGLRRTSVVRCNLPVIARALRRGIDAGATAATPLCELIESYMEDLLTPGYAGEPVDTTGRRCAASVFACFTESGIDAMNAIAVARFAALRV